MPRDILTRRGSRIGIVARDHKAIWCTASTRWLICTHDKHCSATPRNDVCPRINIGDGGTWPAAQPWPTSPGPRSRKCRTMPVCLRGWIRSFKIVQIETTRLIDLSVAWRVHGVANLHVFNHSCYKIAMRPLTISFSCKTMYNWFKD